MQGLTTVGVLLAVEILVGLKARVGGVTELSGFFVGNVAGLRAFAALWMVGHDCSLIPSREQFTRSLG
jgi:hypothetical protein